MSPEALRKLVSLLVLFPLGFWFGYQALHLPPSDPVPVEGKTEIIRAEKAPDPTKIPNGSTPERVMSVDAIDTDPGNFLRILANVSGLEFRRCPALTDHVTYKKLDVPWQVILDEVAAAHHWKVTKSAGVVEVCKE